jgi:hypothetical protein
MRVLPRGRTRRVAVIAAAGLVVSVGGAYGFLAYKSLGSPPALALGAPPPAALPRGADGVWSVRSGRASATATIRGGWLTSAILDGPGLRASLAAPVRLAAAGPTTAPAAVSPSSASARLSFVRAGPRLTVSCACPGRTISLALHRR